MRITTLLAALFATIVLSTDSRASVGTLFGSTNRARSQVTVAAQMKGWDSRQISCLHSLIHRESGYNPKAKNPRSSASGLFQMLRSHTGVPASSLPVKEQIQHGFRYIATTYDTPCAALAFNKRRGWY
jgi:hypothetical protein